MNANKNVGKARRKKQLNKVVRGAVFLNQSCTFVVCKWLVLKRLTTKDNNFDNSTKFFFFLMTEVKAIPSRQLPTSAFLSFKADLEVLLAAFSQQKLADWMKMDKGNLNKKVNGGVSITEKFLEHFNQVMEYPILRLHQGATTREIEDEMELRTKEGTAEVEKSRLRLFEGVVKDVHEEIIDIQGKILDVEEKAEREIGGIKVVLQEHDIAIRELKDAVFRLEGQREGE